MDEQDSRDAAEEAAEEGVNQDYQSTDSKCNLVINTKYRSK